MYAKVKNNNLVTAISRILEPIKQLIAMGLLLLTSVIFFQAEGIAQTRWRGVNVPPTVEVNDLNILAQWKGNLIRWQLDQRDDAARDIAAYDQWLESNLSYLNDVILPVCERHGIKVIIDLHVPPGGRELDANNEVIPGGDHLLFHDKKYQQKFLEIWQRIAERFKKRTVIWGYDLINEPEYSRVGKGLLGWQDLSERTARIISRIDANRKIIVESRRGDPQSLLRIQKLKDASGKDLPNIVYSIHMYEPFKFSHQGIYGNPLNVEYPGRGWDSARLKNYFKAIRDYQLKNDIAIFVGEFSAAAWAPNDSAYNYLRDLIRIFEDYGWDWAYHAYGWPGADFWSVRHCSTDPRNPTALQLCPTPSSRQLLLQRNFARNR